MRGLLTIVTVVIVSLQVLLPAVIKETHWISHSTSNTGTICSFYTSNNKVTVTAVIAVRVDVLVLAIVIVLLSLVLAITIETVVVIHLTPSPHDALHELWA